MKPKKLLALSAMGLLAALPPDAVEIAHDDGSDKPQPKPKPTAAKPAQPTVGKETRQQRRWKARKGEEAMR